MNTGYRMTKDQLFEWLRTISWLRRNFNPQRKVTVRTVLMSFNTCGESWYRAPYFRIRINRRGHFEVKLDALLHEWAHVLTWRGYDSDRNEDHGGEWGLAYSKIYDAWDKWDYKK